MAKVAKLGKRTDLRMSIIKNQASALVWYGKIETTLDRAKSVRSYVEKLLTLAINTYEDNQKVVKEVVDKKGVKSKKEVTVDGSKKLAARRKLMASLIDIQEVRAEKESIQSFRDRTMDINHPIIEKMFNLYAPKYAQRAEEKGTKGGYTRIIRKDDRRGDNATTVILELI